MRKEGWVTVIDTLCNGLTISCGMDGEPFFFDSQAAAQADVEDSFNIRNQAYIEQGEEPDTEPDEWPCYVKLADDGQYYCADSGRPIFNPYA